ncbi:hypothetical protein K402DRAFT_308506, partial [Aulographum hederae CBS 113979]
PPMALFRPLSAQCRAFSTTPIRAGTKETLRGTHAAIPPYPYGTARWYKQSNTGLYGGVKIQFGNIVSEKNEIKTRRRWHPNVQRKKLFSVALNRFIRVKLTARALRTIDKVGGLDEYLLGDKPARVKELGMKGWLLRWRIMQTGAVQRRFRRERGELRIPT